MAGFDWQTEEDGAWGATQPVVQEQPGANGRNWRPIFLVIIGIVLISGLLYWQIRGRVGGAEEARNEDVVAAHNLLVYAADRKDPSVLLNILPLEDNRWTGLQRSLAGQGLLLDRWLLGIQRSDEEPVIKDMVLSPDLQTAEVTVEIPYQVHNQGRIEKIRLQQVYYYRFRNGWHWIEPDAEFWEGPDHEIYQKNNISAFYPRRDDEIVRRLMDDLRNYFVNLCNHPGTPSCRFTLSFLIRFERDPTVFGEIFNRTTENGAYSYIPRFSGSSIGSGMMSLPTPSLVGLPVDEAGYQALLRGYASHILSAILAELYEDECCPNELTFPLFLEGELARRGLGFWPPPLLEREIAAENSPDPLPDKEIALLCTTTERDRLQLIRYNLANGRIWPLLSGRNITRIRSAPDGRGIIAQEVEHLSEEQVLTRIIYWHDNTARILYEETLPEPVFAATSWQVHEEEKRLLLVQSDLDNRVNTFTLIDLSECASGRCPKTTREMIGGPTWSPDSSQFLIKSGNILWWRQFVGNDISQEPLGLGTAPFWVDGDTFGFVRTRENRLQEIVTAAAGNEEMSVVFDSERMRLMLMTEDRPQQLMIGYVGVDTIPAAFRDVTYWTILGFEWFPNGELGQAYVFSYSPEVDALWLHLQSDQLHSFNLSPNGRWLAASLYDDSLESWRLQIEAVVAGQDTSLLPWQATEEAEPPRYDWSADSQWLFILHQGILTLYSPQSGAAQPVPPPIPGCVQAAWMN